MEKTKNAFKILIGKATEKRPSGRPRRRCWENDKMDIKEIGIIRG